MINNLFDLKTGFAEVDKLITEYRGLSMISHSNSMIVLKGTIHVNLNWFRPDNKNMSFTLCKDYKISVKIPINSPDLPTVTNDGKEIHFGYPHIYPNRDLCLDTDSAIRIRFINGFSLVDWMKEYVEPYFYSYEYFQKYHTYPFGQRSHNYEGVLEYYKELWNVTSKQATRNLMQYVAKKKYKGHNPCPCGSGKKLRYCHGSKIYNFMAKSELREIVRNDLEKERKTKNEF